MLERLEIASDDMPVAIRSRTMALTGREALEPPLRVRLGVAAVAEAASRSTSPCSWIDSAAAGAADRGRDVPDGLGLAEQADGSGLDGAREQERVLVAGQDEDLEPRGPPSSIRWVASMPFMVHRTSTITTSGCCPSMTRMKPCRRRRRRR